LFLQLPARKLPLLVGLYQLATMPALLGVLFGVIYQYSKWMQQVRFGPISRAISRIPL
jgi:hypothetical protein